MPSLKRAQMRTGQEESVDPVQCTSKLTTAIHDELHMPRLLDRTADGKLCMLHEHACGMSRLSSSRMPGVSGSSGSLYSFRVRAIVIRDCRPINIPRSGHGR